jgi:hypothetical protein
VNCRFLLTLTWVRDPETKALFVQCALQYGATEYRTYGVPEAAIGPGRSLKAENDAIAKMVKLMAEHGVEFQHLEIVRSVGR